MKRDALFLFAGILIAGTLSAFAHNNIDVFQALGLAVVICGTVFFIGLLLTLAIFGGYVAFHLFQEGVETTKDGLRDSGLLHGR